MVPVSELTSLFRGKGEHWGPYLWSIKVLTLHAAEVCVCVCLSESMCVSCVEVSVMWLKQGHVG